MSQKPLVSVCMITYNHEKYIAQAIEGVLMQKTDFPVELVIGNDCSKDRTAEICKEFFGKNPQTIRILKREKNLGMMPNLVDVLENCQGEYVAICEGDDYWVDENKLQKQIDFLQKHSEYAGSATSARRLLEVENRFTVDDINEALTKEADIRPEQILLGEVMMYTPTLVLRNHIFDFSMLKGYSFGDEFIRLLTASHGLIRFFNYESSVYRIHSGGAMHTLVPSNPYRFYKDWHDFLLIYDQYTEYAFTALIRRRIEGLDRLMVLADGGAHSAKKLLAGFRYLRTHRKGTTFEEINNVFSLGFPKLKSRIKELWGTVFRWTPSRESGSPSV